MSQGTLYIVSAPSGAGKTSLVNALVKKDPQISLSVSHTTRPPRPGEIDGQHYHFVDVDTFKTMINEGAFIEYAQVFDNYYGTSRSALTTPLEEGRDVILEIDWQGAEQVRRLIPEAQSIFILPPSKAALEERLRGRGQDSDEVIARRMRDAEAEMKHYNEFDFLIINDEFETALNELHCIFIAQRMRCSRQSAKHKQLINTLLSV
ncbi:MAG TPA: guanylate kinase [Halothiobacillus sp.]|nr:guanylate kinase [Halothiobacillus sp.]